jgi:predicted Zn-dependent protease
MDRFPSRPWIRTARLVLAALALGLGLSACAGAIHQLPVVSEADVNRATSEIEHADSLASTKRTPAQNAVIVRRVANRLEAAAAPICGHVESPTCRFNVVFDPSDEVNAYADGTNRITINQGLAQYLETDSEFAAVIAHEMGHHMSDHITKLQENAAAGAIVSGILFGALAVATGAYDYNPSGFTDSLGDVMQAGGSVGMLSYSKEHEREADYIAAYLMARAGYDLNQGRELWATLTQASGNFETELFDTHPSGPDRLAAWDITTAEVERSPDLLPNLIGEEDDPNAAPLLSHMAQSASSEPAGTSSGTMGVTNQASSTSSTVAP